MMKVAPPLGATVTAAWYGGSPLSACDSGTLVCVGVVVDSPEEVDIVSMFSMMIGYWSGSCCCRKAKLGCEFSVVRQ